MCVQLSREAKEFGQGNGVGHKHCNGKIAWAWTALNFLNAFPPHNLSVSLTLDIYIFTIYHVLKGNSIFTSEHLSTLATSMTARPTYLLITISISIAITILIAISLYNSNLSSLQFSPTMPPKPKLNVHSFPRPPLLEKTSRHLQIKWHDQIIADTKDAYWVLETTHPPST